ncbi:D-dopachrome decarboxylase-like isoform X2 [Saccoglossus kowalevskii]
MLVTVIKPEKIRENINTRPDLRNERVIVAIHSCQRIMIAGSLDPAIIMDLDAIDRFGPEKNQKYSDEIFKFLAEKTGLGFDRIKLKFYDLPAYDVGVYSKATQ